jgi:hypothetical protein
MNSYHLAINFGFLVLFVQQYASVVFMFDFNLQFGLPWHSISWDLESIYQHKITHFDSEIEFVLSLDLQKHYHFQLRDLKASFAPSILST